MPIYNIEGIRKNFLTAINSILNQTYKNIEFIFVDDCSPKNAEEKIKLNLY